LGYGRRYTRGNVAVKEVVSDVVEMEMARKKKEGGGRYTSSGVKSGRIDDQENMVATSKSHPLWFRRCCLLGGGSRQCRRTTAISK